MTPPISNIKPLGNGQLIIESNAIDTANPDNALRDNTPHLELETQDSSNPDNNRNNTQNEDKGQEAQQTLINLTSDVFRILGSADEFKVFSTGVTAYLIHKSGRIISLSPGLDREHIQFNDGRGSTNSALKNPLGEFFDQQRQIALQENSTQETAPLENTESPIETEENIKPTPETLVRYTRQGQKEGSYEETTSWSKHYKPEPTNDQDDLPQQYQANGQISERSSENKGKDTDSMIQQEHTAISAKA